MSESSSRERYIFLAAPHSASTAELRDALNLASAEAGFQLMRSDQTHAPSQTIQEHVRQAIQHASLVIGDVSGSNANVMWEIGFAQALGKPILLVAQDPGSIRFDLSSLRAVIYQPGSSFDGMVARLTDAIVSTLAAGVQVVPLTRAKARDKVFFSYSHCDREYLDRILIHLRPVERAGLVNLWSDTMLVAGDRWREEIERALGEARVAVLLISADFLASDFIETDELPPLLVAAESNGARVIPVILKPSRFLRDDRLSRFQALNDPKRPLIGMDEAEREEIYAKLADLVEIEIRL